MDVMGRSTWLCLSDGDTVLPIPQAHINLMPSSNTLSMSAEQRRHALHAHGQRCQKTTSSANKAQACMTQACFDTKRNAGFGKHA